MNDARLIAASDNVLFPMIELKIQQRVDLAVGKFNGGETNFVADIAYISGLKMIKNELTKLVTAGNNASLELNKDLIK